jgi:hypothetical protein
VGGGVGSESVDGSTEPSERPSQKLEPGEIRARLQALLAARDEIDWAYVFGSFLDGPGYHDIDVGVYLRLPLPRQQVFDYEMELSVGLTMTLHTQMDVHVLNDAPMGFQHAILQGEPLIVRDQDRLADFIERIGWEVMEFAHHAEDYLREVLS